MYVASWVILGKWGSQYSLTPLDEPPNHRHRYENPMSSVASNTAGLRTTSGE